MSNEPIITVVGNLTNDPELRFTPSGAAVANFTVAQTPRTKQGDDWKDGETIFFNCSVWREAAENAAESLTKGMRVLGVGRMKVRAYETRDGEKRTSIEVDLDEVGPSLRYATAKVTKAGRGGGGGQRSGGSGADPWAASGPAQGQGQQRQPAASAGSDPWGAGNRNDEPPF